MSEIPQPPKRKYRYRDIAIAAKQRALRHIEEREKRLQEEMQRAARQEEPPQAMPENKAD